MKPTDRFSDRVEEYIRYRPSYPPAVIAFLRQELELATGSDVADVGSGTGIFTRLLLDAGYHVYAVEPNRQMREAAERLLGGFADFVSVDGTGEHTTLESRCVDAVAVAQAFHWLDAGRARQEFGRILRPNGVVVLLWNDRREDAGAFAREYQDLIDEYNTDLATVDHRRITRDDTAGLATLFDSDGYSERIFGNYQDLDFEGLRGRLLSSSYIPGPGTPRYDEMIAELRTLFDRHALDGSVRIEYDTRVYYGRIGGTE